MLPFNKKGFETVKNLFAIDPAIVPVILSLLRKTFIVCLLISCIFWVSGFGVYIPGLIFGAVTGWINFFFMGKGVTAMAKSAVLAKKNSAGQKRLIFGYFIRYLILVTAFIVAASLKIFYLGPFILGLFLIQIILYIEYVVMGYANENK